MKVEQYKHANQFHLYRNDDLVENVQHDYLQSYNSLVVKIITFSNEQQIILGRDWDYSTTTSKHVYEFLEEYSNINFYGVSNKRAYINKLIEDGVIKYDATMC